MIDFVTEGKRKGSVLRSWHIQGPATSLALLSSSFKPTLDYTAQDNAKSLNRPRRRVLVAIGRQDGKVLLYDLNGHLFREHNIGLDGSRIIELEWTSDAAGLEVDQPDPGLAVPSVPPSKQSRRSGGMSPASTGAPIARVFPVIDGANDEIEIPPLETLAERESSKEPVRQPYLARPALNHLDCFTSTQHTGHGEDHDVSNNPDASLASDRFNNRKVKKNSSPLRGEVHPSAQPSVDVTLTAKPFPIKRNQGPLLSPFSSRPVTRKGGGPSIALAEKSDQVTPRADVDPSPDKQSALVSDASDPRVFNYLRPKRLDVSATNRVTAKHGDGEFKLTVDKGEDVSPVPLDDNEWTDVAPSSRKPIRRFKGKLARIEKRKDRKASSIFQPISSVVSEASNDIVVEWTPASARLDPSSSLLPHRLPEIPPRTAKSLKKTHTSSTMSNDTIVQWTSFKKGHVFAMHNNTLNRKAQLPSSSASPKDRRNATPVKHEPLAEASHNPRKPVLEPPSSPSRLPPPPPTIILSETPKPCDHSSQLEAGIKTLRDEIELHFQTQKTWFEHKFDDLNEGIMRMEGENRRARKELEKTKGKERAIVNSTG